MISLFLLTFRPKNPGEHIGRVRGTRPAMGVSQIIVEGVPPLPLVINHPGGHGSPPCYVFVNMEPCRMPDLQL